VHLLVKMLDFMVFIFCQYVGFYCVHLLVNIWILWCAFVG